MVSMMVLMRRAESDFSFVRDRAIIFFIFTLRQHLLIMRGMKIIVFGVAAA